VSVRVRAYLCWAIICIVWGTTYLGIRVTLETLPPGLSAGLRWLIAGSLLVAGHVATGRRLPPRAEWRGFAVLGILFIVAGNGLVVVAEQWVPSGLTAVLLATTPFWMVGLERLLPHGERPTSRTWAGLVVGFGGIVLLVWPEMTAGGATGTRFVFGVISLQLACIAWSAGSAYTRSRHQERSALGGAALQMIVGGLILTAIGSAAGEWPRVAFSARSAVAFGYLVIVGSIVAYSSYIYTLKHLPVSTISLYAYINPVIAMVLGSLILAEPFGVRTAAASAIVLAGVALVRPTTDGEDDGDSRQSSPSSVRVDSLGHSRPSTASRTDDCDSD
jgi:drug/metabolite transporter (DMT)-like permease